MRKWSAVILLFCAPIAIASGPKLGAQDLVEIVSMLLQTGSNDLIVAQTVKSLEVADRLTPESVALLKEEGAGSDTLSALRHLVPKQAHEPLSNFEPGPTAEEAKEQIDRIGEYVSTYVQTLVAFNCKVRSRVYQSQRSSYAGGVSVFRDLPETNWWLTRTLNQVLRYSSGRELYRDASAKDSELERSDATPHKIQSWSQGEFAALLDITFAPSSKAQFHWDHWENANGRHLAVLSYDVKLADSQFLVGTQALVQGRWQPPIDLRVAYKGLVYADRDSGEIVRFTARAFEIPENYALDYGDTMLDYGPVNLGGKSFLLLTHSTTYMKTKEYCGLIRKDFSDYRKFEAESRFLVGP